MFYFNYGILEMTTRDAVICDMRQFKHPGRVDGGEVFLYRDKKINVTECVQYLANIVKFLNVNVEHNFGVVLTDFELYIDFEIFEKLDFTIIVEI